MTGNSRRDGFLPSETILSETVGGRFFRLKPSDRKQLTGYFILLKWSDWKSCTIQRTAGSILLRFSEQVTARKKLLEEAQKKWQEKILLSAIFFLAVFSLCVIFIFYKKTVCNDGTISVGGVRRQSGFINIHLSIFTVYGTKCAVRMHGESKMNL